MLRRRHRRAARRHLRRRPRRRGLSGRSRRSIRPSCSAPTTRSCTTSRSSSLPVRFAIDRAGLVGADGATHAGAFDLAYLGCLPGFVVMAAADEAELDAHGGDRGGDRRPAVGVPLSARRGRRRRAAGAAACRSRSARAASSARAPRSRILSLRHAAAGGAEGGRRAGRARLVDHRRRRPLRQAARRGPDPPAGARARGADHRSRKARSAASPRRSCSSWRARACSTAASRFRPMMLPDSFIDQDKPEQAIRAGRPRRRPHRRHGAAGARQGRGRVTAARA